MRLRASPFLLPPSLRDAACLVCSWRVLHLQAELKIRVDSLTFCVGLSPCSAFWGMAYVSRPPRSLTVARRELAPRLTSSISLLPSRALTVRPTGRQTFLGPCADLALPLAASPGVILPDCACPALLSGGVRPSAAPNAHAPRVRCSPPPCPPLPSLQAERRRSRSRRTSCCSPSSRLASDSSASSRPTLLVGRSPFSPRSFGG